MRLFLGVDVVDLSRFRRAWERQGERLARRLFTPQERAACGHRLASLAARFAAKEAAAKALGTGIGPITWHDLEIRTNEHGAPVLVLHGPALEQARTLGWQTWEVSLSHTPTCAVAVVVALGTGKTER